MTEAPAGKLMAESSISWPGDVSFRFEQVDGFTYSIVPPSAANPTCQDVLGADYADCKTYIDPRDKQTYFYWYPNDENVQYLHESFPNIVSPIEGVKNEHFINWMRTAGLPHFRKLYGVIEGDISIGDRFVFNIETNFEVASISGSKALVLTTLADFGGQNYALGRSAIIIGVVSLGMGLLFGAKRILHPRPLGDIRQLNWNN
jgi:LEM3 (ligand-effect modulator 3) family / CDC50 family